MTEIRPPEGRMNAKRCRSRGSGPAAGALRIPTMGARGYDMAVGSWKGLSIAEDLPRPDVERLHQVGRAVMKNPTVIRFCSEIVASTSSPASPEGTSAHLLKGEISRFARVIARGNIQTDQGVVFWVSSNNSDWRVRCQQTLG